MTIDAIISIIGIMTMVGIDKSQKSSIQVSKALKERLDGLYQKKGDTYEAILWRLLNGSKGDAHEDRGAARDEHTGDRDQETG